jgi:hypothetical protein
MNASVDTYFNAALFDERKLQFFKWIAVLQNVSELIRSGYERSYI